MNSHGGKRKGAGRPESGRRAHLIRMKPGPVTIKRELDWEIVKSESDGKFDVWIAGYKLGAIVGMGKTRQDAILNTIKSCAVLQHELAELLEERSE